MKIEDIEGIGPKYAELLRTAGVDTPAKLLDRGATRKGREELNKNLGINDGLILKWVNMCDLCRISGVSTQYSELLEEAGVDTIKELRNRNAENLTTKMKEINDTKNLVKRTPTLNEVSNWIEQAKELAPAVFF
jgi:predicted flap endonuclease-1-like 5' DNA nuclease